MASVAFPFHAGHPVVEILLRAPNGTNASRRLAVDSGFTGMSAFVLPTSDTSLADRSGPAGHVSGAISGLQERVWVIASVPSIRFHYPFLAICTNVSSLLLPSGIDGLAGLTFLQRLHQWGAHRDGVGKWSFEIALYDDLA